MPELATFGLALLISFLSACGLYFSARFLAPKGKKSKDKLMPYACGEKYPAEKFQFRLQWFYYAVFFTILETAGFLVFTSAFANPLYGGIFVAFATIAAVLVLYRT
ncbi:MAG: NADH-quinone oxidoreductase subunit A [Candidatus Jordarchaeaceae archaeon]